MTFTTHQKKRALLFIAGAVAIGFFVQLYVTEAKADIVAHLHLQIVEQEKRLGAIAEVTGRDGADAVVEKIIQDCSPEKRTQFDTQLSQLPTLKGVQLDEVEQLFSSCGNFFAERKAVMVSRLEREYEVYKDLLTSLTLVDSKGSAEQYRAEDWGKLVALEVTRSELSTKLVEIQGKIIRDLKANVNVKSDSMQVTLVDGQKTKEALFAISSEIYTLRQSILDI